MDEEQSFNPDDYPSIRAAYDLVIPSYDWALRRLDSIDRRIDNLLRYVVTVTLAVPAGTVGIAGISGTPLDLSFNEALWLVIASFAITLLWGVFIRQIGGVQVIDLESIFNEHLEDSEEEFKKDIIFTAGQHAKANECISRRKSFGADLMVVLFVVEVGALLTWSFGVLGQ